jgi:hypothetical protein
MNNLELKEHLLVAPDGHLDASMKPLIEKWNDTPTAIQILEVLDHCIYSALASGIVVTLLQTMLEYALKNENKVLSDIEPLATWRKQ